MSLANNTAVANVLIAFINAHDVNAVPRDIAAMVESGDTIDALIAIFNLGGFDFSDFANASPVLSVLCAADADDISAIFGNDGSRFRCGTLDLNTLLREFGAVEHGDLRDGAAVVFCPCGGYIAVSGGTWDIVELYEDGPEGEGWYSFGDDGMIDPDGWFFAA